MALPRRLALALLSTPALLPRPGRAQGAFPGRPVRIVVPFPAGATTDILARLYAQRLSETMGQPVVVENRAGGGGTIGTDLVAKAAADGHTLLFHNISFSTASAALERLGRAPYNPERDLAPVSMGADVPYLLMAIPRLGVRSLTEFVAYARASREPVFYGSTGPGTPINLVGELLKRRAGIALEHVPFRGAAPLVQEMLAGRIPFGGDQLPSSLARIRAGELVAVATLAAERPAALPAVPTVRELGYPELELLGWNGFFVPAATPAPVVARLHREIAAAAAEPELRRRILELGATPGGNTPAEFGAAVRAQLAKVRPLVAQLQLEVE